MENQEQNKPERVMVGIKKDARHELNSQQIQLLNNLQAALTPFTRLGDLSYGLGGLNQEIVESLTKNDMIIYSDDPMFNTLLVPNNQLVSPNGIPISSDTFPTDEPVREPVREPKVIDINRNSESTESA